MIAPLVQGFRTRRHWIAGLVAYSVCLPAGAMLLAVAAYHLSRLVGTMPLWVVGAAATIAAASGLGWLPIDPPESHWRVPQNWGRFGHVCYAGLFGVVLGLGVLTAVPSFSLYVVIAWVFTGPAWHQVWPIFLGFSIARLLPALLVVMMATRSREHPFSVLESITKATGLARRAEIAVLAALGVQLLLLAGP